MSTQIDLKQRKSEIELLKIIAMFLIVISHCVQSVIISEDFILNNINIGQPTTDIAIFITQIMYYFGMIGNSVFLICSVWFLVDSNNMRVNKIAHMVMNVYMLSVIFLLIFCLTGVKLSVNDIIKSLLPTTFANNWYITCYILLYAIYPLLNTIINKLTQKQHLAYNCAFLILYFCIGSIKESFFINDLICFIAIYFIVAYIKKYNLRLASCFKINLIFLFAGIVLLLMLQLSMNFAGFHIDAIGQRMFHFRTNHNPVILIIAVSVFNIFRNMKICANAVNYIAALTMFVYVVHENILFREYLRPDLLFKLWVTSGKMNIALFVLICGLILFAASILIAMVYNKLIQPIAEKAAEKTLKLCLKLYNKFEALMLKIN